MQIIRTSKLTGRQSILPCNTFVLVGIAVDCDVDVVRSRIRNALLLARGETLDGTYATYRKWTPAPWAPSRRAIYHLADYGIPLVTPRPGICQDRQAPWART